MDLLRAQDASHRRVSDPEVLEWAASEGRVLVTHDVNTMVGFAWERVRKGLAMPGLIAIPSSVSVSRAIDELEMIAGVMDEDDLKGRVVFVSASLQRTREGSGPAHW